MQFNVISTQTDIDILMEKFNGFHDSCIKELKYYSGSYVEENRCMFPLNSIRNVSILFQSQRSEFSAIEMKFEQIHKLNLEPRLDNDDSIIYEASLTKISNIFYWGEWGDLELEDLDKVHRTWISCERIRWRKLENVLGKKEIYIMNQYKEH